MGRGARRDPEMAHCSSFPRAVENAGRLTTRGDVRAVLFRATTQNNVFQLVTPRAIYKYLSEISLCFSSDEPFAEGSVRRCSVSDNCFVGRSNNFIDVC